MELSKVEQSNISSKWDQKKSFIGYALKLIVSSYKDVGINKLKSFKLKTPCRKKKTMAHRLCCEVYLYIDSFTGQNVKEQRILFLHIKNFVGHCPMSDS